MEERTARIVAGIDSFDKLAQFENNAARMDALDDEVQQAIRRKLAQLGRMLISERTGLNLDNLSPAEERIVEAVSEYIGVMKHQGKDATRTLLQLKNRGLLEAAEEAVKKAAPTQGFTTLTEVGREDLSYEQIIVDHPEEFTPRALWYARRTLRLPNALDKPPAKGGTPVQARTEIILRWLEQRSRSNGGRIPTFTNADIGLILGMSDMHRHGRVLGNIQSRIDFACYRAGLPPLGLAAVAPFGLAWRHEEREWAFPKEQIAAAAQSRIWKPEDFAAILNETLNLPGQAHTTWELELSTNGEAVRAWAFGLTANAETEAAAPETKPTAEQETDAPPAAEAPYWVFVCNPKKWAIDKFLESRIERDSWGVRKSDQNRFAPGQLGILRVGVDQRNSAERDGKPRLEPGIYALCEVESASYPGTGATDEFWAEGAARDPGWPTVRIRYLRTYASGPLTIGRLRAEAPQLSPLLLDGFQASSFPISADDFHTVLGLLGENLDELPAPETEPDISAAQLPAMEQKYLRANVEVKERMSKFIERGPVGVLVKKANGYRCQLCEALGMNPLGFKKKDGQRYIEAHHVMPVSQKQVGSLAASNIMTLCANHHRQVHYGGIEVSIEATTFDLVVDGQSVKLARPAIA